MSLDSVAMQTVISKSLGPVAQWASRLEVTAKSNFNWIHFTPVQLLGKGHLLVEGIYHI